MQSRKETSTKLTVFLLVSLFLCADLLVPQTQDGWAVLEEQTTVSRTISSHSPTADTYINESSAQTNYNTSSTAYLIPTEGDETRILIDFPMNFSSTDTIHNASLELSCTVLSGQALSDISVYPASVLRNWNSTVVTWNNFNTNQVWSGAGADSTSDRNDWEPPTVETQSGRFSINVTALAQQAASSNQGKLRLVIAAVGASYACELSETQSSNQQPELIIDSSSGAPTSGGAVEFDLPIENGGPWMTNDFILTAETLPTISYKNHTASDIELYISHSSDWKDGSVSTYERHYSTLWNTFQTTGSSGSFTIPANDEFDNGTNVYARIRSIDTNLQMSDWQEYSFVLPSHSITDNGDGTATISIERDDLGLEDYFIQDATVSQTSVTANAGGSPTVDTAMTSTKEQLGHIRLSLNQLGLHDNLTIVDSTLTYERSSYSGSSVVSLHGMEESGLWVESEITWNQMSDNGVAWYDGGRSNGTETIDLFNSNQVSSTFDFNLTHAVQNYLDDSDATPMDMFVALRGKYEGYTNGDNIFFHSADTMAGTPPTFDLTYKWGSGAPQPVTITAPEDGLAIWNKTGDNLSGNTQPTLNWSISSSNDDILFQIARDEDFRLLDLVLDTRSDNDFAPTDGTFTMNETRTLSKGNMYFWRMATVDSSGHYGTWESSSFIVSNLESTYLGNDRYEFRIRHGNGTNDNQYPECMDTFIDSGSVNDNFNGDSEMSIEYNGANSKSTIIMGCNLVSNLLPSGYAVESAQLRMTLTDSPFSSPVIGVWENRQNNWSDDDATWSSYDGSNSWASSGATGWERGSLLSSQTLTGVFSGGDVVQWNVTQAVQNAMRESRRVDFVVDQIGIPSGGFSSAYFSTAESNSASERPEITFVYMPGSDALPQDPTPISPLNGSWSIGTGVDLTPVTTPEFEWNFTGSMSLGGWIVQIDDVSTFDSGNSITYTSWNDAGFDTQNLTFTPATGLTTGETYHWRVRAISSTNQIGNWSNIFHFHLPDLTTWVENSTTAAVEIHHHEALPDLQIPHLYDTYVLENGSGSASTHETAQTLPVGRHSNGYLSSALIKIPLNDIPQPTNARVVNAELNVFSDLSSDSNLPIAVRPVLVNWNESANATTYDGVNNWTELGGRSIGNDVGSYSDIVLTVTDDWMNWDVTELVQLALANGQSYLSVMLYAPTSTNDRALLYSTEHNTESERPWLNLTWATGAASTPTIAATNAGPMNNAVMWDTTSHAVQANHRPTMSWSHPSASNITAWRVFILQDASDDMAGLYTFDSRVNTSAFDLQNLAFTPPVDLDFAEEIRWMVQPIRNGMIGPRSNSSLFFIPTVVGGEINSTDANIMIQEGSMIQALNYPVASEDTFLDSGNTQASQGSQNSLYVGRSLNSYNSANLRTTSLVNIDLASVPLPGTYEVVNATLDFNVIGFTGNEISVSISEMISAWNESSTWDYPAGNNTSWLGTGAYHSADSDAIHTIENITLQSGLIQFNVTALLQHALANGQTDLNVLIQPEENSGGNVVGRVQFASSEHVNITLRPRINMTYRAIPTWSMPAPTNLVPADGSILWNTSSPLPRGQNTSTFSMTPGASNETRFVFCTSDEPRFSIDAECFDSNAMPSGYLFDASTNALEVTDVEKGDFWHYWRVRADQDHRIGEWSAIHSFRNPIDFGTNSSGNYSINLTRGSIFEATGLLPEANDVSLFTNQTSTAGAASSMNLGFSSAGESQIFINFNLSEIHLPTNVMPTNVILKLYRSAINGNSASTISAHACDEFSESSVTWATKPSCSSNEITRTTLTLLPPNQWIDWDITSLAQSNIANGNYTFTIMLKNVGTPLTTHTFASADSTQSQYHPALQFDYVDNVNNITPPSQPTLLSPDDGEVLYNIDNGTIVSKLSPTLSWGAVSNADGYMLTVSNASGVYKYKSWETNSGITGTTFQFNESLEPGEIFTWWVTAIRQNIPGASSARWTFAVGDPSHTYNNDETFTYEFQTGNEVESFGHTNIQDSTLSSENADVNLGDGAVLQAGTFCGTLYADECRTVFSIDPSQIPFDSNQSVHSVAIGLYLNDWVSAQGATLMTFDVYPLLTTAWSQSGSTWNESSTGVAWSTPGLGSGVEYAIDPVSSTTMSIGQTGWIWFDISTIGMNLTNVQGWVIIGTTNAGYAHGEFYSSEYMGDISHRPLILFNTTNITTISVSPGGTTIDADSNQLFSATVTDHNTVDKTSQVQLVWSSSTGSIGTNGLFTPTTSGTQTVFACFGLVCGSQTISVTPGAPATLQVSPLSATISADETLTITADMVDQHGNAVPGVSLTYSPSNGTMSGAEFLPYAVGQHTIIVSHPSSGNSVTIDVTVTSGAPDYFEVSGCSGTVAAGKDCDITTLLFDQFGNPLDLADAGALTWTTTNGNYSEVNQKYSPDHVGSWFLNMSSSVGLTYSLPITVGHGDMSYLEIISSDDEITADDIIYLNTTRVDVRGNRLPVYLPLNNWTKYADGIITPGQPATWEPNSRGSKVLEARYEDKTASVTIVVLDGKIETLILLVNSEDVSDEELSMTADDSIEIKVRAIDGKGNPMDVSAEWLVSHASLPSVISSLEEYQGDAVVERSVQFSPYTASELAYTITASFTEDNTTHVAQLDVVVAPGVLEFVNLQAAAGDGVPSSLFEISADDHVQFDILLTDANENPLDDSTVRWLLYDNDAGTVEDITVAMLYHNLMWNATKVGSFEIVAYAINSENYNISTGVDISVYHGNAVEVFVESSAQTITAGSSVQFIITGKDADNNQFSQTVQWTEDGDEVDGLVSFEDQDGVYEYTGTIAGVHLLNFGVGTIGSEIEITVEAQSIVARLEVALSTDTVEQLESFEISIRAFDMYENEIDVPPSVQVDAAGRATSVMINSSTWKITTLDEGTHSITVGVGSVLEKAEFSVTGTLEGFFESGGTLYYVGAVLGFIAAIGVLAGLVVFLRSNNTDWDLEDDEYEDDDVEVAPSSKGPTGGPSTAAGPTGRPPSDGPTGAPPVEESVEPEHDDDEWDYTQDESYRVDEEGTEWYQDDEGTWWYRAENDEDWSAWEE